jgi:hypothetical protein
MKKVSKDELQVEVEIPGNFISENAVSNVDFLIIMRANFPLAAPKVFSKTGVSISYLIVIKFYLRLKNKNTID